MSIKLILLIALLSVASCSNSKPDATNAQIATMEEAEIVPMDSIEIPMSSREGAPPLPEKTWDTFNATPCDFSILMPSGVKSTIETGTLPQGTKIEQHIHQSTFLSHSYSAICTILPETVSNPEAADLLMQISIENVAGDLIEEEELEMDQWSGRKYVKSFADAMFFYGHVYVVDNKVAHLAVSRVEKVDFNKDPDLRRFFESIKFRQ